MEIGRRKDGRRRRGREGSRGDEGGLGNAAALLRSGVAWRGRGRAAAFVRQAQNPTRPT
jgi:hypothetical protein